MQYSLHYRYYGMSYDLGNIFSRMENVQNVVVHIPY